MVKIINNIKINIINQSHYYMNAGIYAIKNKNTDNIIYVGSSVDPNERKKQHLHNINNEKKQEKIYNTIRDLGIENIEFGILEGNIKCDSLNELKKYEQKWKNKYFDLSNSVNVTCDINDYNYYENSCIYKIVNKLNGKIIYIGSSSQDVQLRIKGHRKGIRNGNNKLYRKIRQIGVENIKFKVVEKFPCYNEVQLHQREFRWINYYKPECNSMKNLRRLIKVKGHEKIEKKKMIDYNMSINLFPNKKYVCRCGGLYTLNHIADHAVSDICVKYRIENNIPLVERNYIKCEICGEEYTTLKIWIKLLNVEELKNWRKKCLMVVLFVLNKMQVKIT